MREMPGPVLEETESLPLELYLLIAAEPWFRIFTRNFRDLFRAREVPLRLQSAPAPFWPDVFVEGKLPRRRFFESGGYHILAILMIWVGSRFMALQPRVTPLPAPSHADVVYYSPSEYLPPLDTRRSKSTHARKADPEFSAQPIISLPPEADNRAQTIVTPPKVQLEREVALPNTVAWADTPRMPIAPAPAPLVPASEISRLAPRLEHSVIAPPPALDSESNRRLGEMEIGHSAVIAPAPQLALEEQHATLGRSSALRGHAQQVVAPPPTVGMQGGTRSAGMVALSLHPAVGAPPVIVAGNRRGSFAATPEGHRGASGAPGEAAASNKDGNGAGAKSNGNLPTGLYVGKVANSSENSVNPRLIAGLRTPRNSQTPQSESGSKISDAERAIFGARKVYSLSLNMPNLNSAGGSWIIRFAALKADSASASGESASSDLSSPVAKRKVDPAYPLELMKQNVSGTVILYAVILADGTVGRVRVLRSVDERIDRFASDAVAKWQFQPATKNGDPVAVEATFWIPFRPTKTTSGF
jgi:TonB family protein